MCVCDNVIVCSGCGETAVSVVLAGLCSLLPDGSVRLRRRGQVGRCSEVGVGWLVGREQ